MRENEVHSSPVDIEVVAEVFPAHRRALAVPSRESVAPRTWPAHDMLWRSFLPKSEVHLVFLLPHSIELSALVDNIVEVAMREDAVVVHLIIFLDIEIHTAVADVCKSVVDYLFHEFFLLDNMSRGMRFDAWRQNIQRLHCVMIAVGIILCYLHRLQLLQSCLLLNLVVAFVGIMLKMPHIGDVSHVAHLIAKVLQVTEHEVECYCRTCMSEMRIAIYRRTAYIHTHIGSMERFETLFLPCEGIVNKKCLLHIVLFLLFSLLGGMGELGLIGRI